jgi:hypothetical protein
VGWATRRRGGVGGVRVRGLGAGGGRLKNVRGLEFGDMGVRRSGLHISSGSKLSRGVRMCLVCFGFL